MTETTPTFLASFRLNPDGRGTELSLDEIENRASDQGHTWIHIDVADDESYKWLSRQADIPPFALDTLLADETRPRSVITEEGLLIVLRGVNTNPAEDPEDMVSIRIWMDGQRVISTRRRRLLSVTDIRDALLAGKGPKSTGALLTMLVERLADRIGDFVAGIDHRLDEAEDGIEDPSNARLRPQIASLRREVASVRRFLAPQRDALDRLNRLLPKFFDEADANTLRQEADRFTRYIEDLDLARERAIVLQEEALSHIAQQQNARMYVLSVVAAVFLPLTFVTGLLGMNVGGLPGVENPSGFVVATVVMVACGLVVLMYFRWKKWF